MRHESPAWPGLILTVALGIVAILGLAGLAVSLWRPAASAPQPQGGERAAADGPRTPTLYCEFNNFADLTPLVGFYFRKAETGQAYTLIHRRDQDGSRIDAGGPELSARPWTVARSGETASLESPDDDTAINLYTDDPGRPGTGWFEAGLRSIRYRNLGGRCRHGT